MLHKDRNILESTGVGICLMLLSWHRYQPRSLLSALLGASCSAGMWIRRSNCSWGCPSSSACIAEQSVWPHAEVNPV